MDPETKQAFTMLSTQVLKEIADLALSVKFGFDDIDQKLNDRFDKVDTRIDTLYKNTDGFVYLHRTLEMELASTRLQQGRLEERVDRLETRAK